MQRKIKATCGIFHGTPIKSMAYLDSMYCIELYCIACTVFLYWVIESRQVKLWVNKNCCGNMSCRWVFPQLFQVLPNFHRCFYISIETLRTCFLFPLENTAMQKRKSTCVITYLLDLFTYLLSKCNFLCSRHHNVPTCASSLFLSSYRNTVLNQPAHVFAMHGMACLLPFRNELVKWAR